MASRGLTFASLLYYAYRGAFKRPILMERHLSEQREERTIMKISTKQITTTAVLLAICIVSQFFKNASVYITGPIINACLILAVLSVGTACGLILAVVVRLITRKVKGNGGLIAGMAAGSVLKALFMGIVISLILIPALLPEAMLPNMAVFQTTFSVTQLITSLIGSVYAYIIWIPLKKVMA